MHSVLTHGAHRVTVVAVVDAPVRDARIEAQEVGVERVALVERRQPVVAARPSDEEYAIPAAARSGKENGTAIRTDELPAIHAVLSSPRRSTAVHQLLHLHQRRHAPWGTPVGSGSIVAGAGNVAADVY